MKKIGYLFASLFIYAVFASSAVAFNAENVTLSPIISRNVIQGEFDVLAMDLTVLPPHGTEDTLVALALKNDGLAQDTRDIERLVLWQDNGPIGFRGMGEDLNLGSATYHDGSVSWYWQGLNLSVPGNGVRLFVSAEIGKNPVNNNTIQLRVPLVSDNGGSVNANNKSYDIGDLGLFFSSGEIGPEDTALTMTERLTIRPVTSDNLAPKAIMTNVKNGQSIEQKASYKIMGEARDHGDSTPMEVKLYIDGQGYLVNSTSSNYRTWEYEWLSPVLGSHQLSLETVDWLNNRATTAVINVEVTEPTPTVTEPAVAPPVELLPAGLTAGTLIKASGPAVYYLGRDAKRYVFPNEQTYRSWYEDFSTVQVITDELLSQLPIGGNVTYRPGLRLIKITTDPKVYAVDRGGELRWLKTERVAELLFGADWAKLVDDVPDTFFVNYLVGDPIDSQLDFAPSEVRQTVTDINIDKQL